MLTEFALLVLLKPRALKILSALFVLDLTTIKPNAQLAILTEFTWIQDCVSIALTKLIPPTHA